MEGKHVNITEALAFGWQTMRQHFWFFVGIYIISGVISLIPQLLSSANETLLINNFFGLGLTFILIIGFGLISTIVSLGRFRISLMFVDQQQPRLTDLFGEARLLLRFIGASIIRGLIVLVGLILFIIPGIILSISLSFYVFALLDEDAGVTDSLRRSWELTRGVKWQLFVFGIILGLINLLGVLALGVGLLLTAPTTLVAILHVYRQLTQQTAKPTDQSAPAPTKLATPSPPSG